MYGLKQASCQWFAKLASALISLGYKQSLADYSLFTLSTDTSFTTVLIYIDDILLVGNDMHVINSLKQYLDNTFSIKNLVSIKYYLGLEVTRSATGLFISQRKYSLDLLDEAHLTDCKPLAIPLDQHLRLNDKEGLLLKDPFLYRIKSRWLVVISYDLMT